MWNEVTFLWNELTILWNDLTTDWNDLTWNDLTMERNDRIPNSGPSSFLFYPIWSVRISRLKLNIAF